jgi:glutathione S-transferase
MADDEIVFYHQPRSRAQMAHWMLEEVAAPYRTVILDLEKGEHKTPAFLALNAMGKVPTIVHRGVTIAETGAIISYLADAFPAAGLAPALTDPQRGAYLRWLFFGAGCIEPALADRMLQRPPVERKIALGYGSYEDVQDTLRQALSKAPYLTGDRFTAADLYVGAQINWAGHFGAPGFKGDPVFDAYVARITQRPAFERAAKADGMM